MILRIFECAITAAIKSLSNASSVSELATQVFRNATQLASQTAIAKLWTPQLWTTFGSQISKNVVIWTWFWFAEKNSGFPVGSRAENLQEPSPWDVILLVTSQNINGQPSSFTNWKCLFYISHLRCHAIPVAVKLAMKESFRNQVIRFVKQIDVHLEALKNKKRSKQGNEEKCIYRSIIHHQKRRNEKERREVEKRFRLLRLNFFLFTYISSWEGK